MTHRELVERLLPSIEEQVAGLADALAGSGVTGEEWDRFLDEHPEARRRAAYRASTPR
jgi:hypothetical protein